MAVTYDDSEANLLRPVEVAEVRNLLAGGVRHLAKHPGHLTHLLTRMLHTLTEADEARYGLLRHVAEQTNQSARTGAPTTLNPLDALRYLDDDQKEQIVDRITRERLGVLRALVERAQQDREVLVGQLATVRLVATTLSEQVDLPPHVRAAITRQLASLPTQAGEVHYPTMLDMPDPEPAPPPPARTAPVRPGAAHPGLSQVTPPAAVTYVDPYSAAPTYVDPYSTPPTAGAFSDPYSTQSSNGGGA